MIRHPGILLVLLGLLSHSNALHQDQAGTFDWHHQHVGGVLSASSPAGRSKIALVTDRNVVASIRSRDGSIAWRKHLGGEERVAAQLTHDKLGVAIAVTGSGGLIRCFDSNTGTLSWEASTGAKAEEVALLPVGIAGSQFLAVLVGGSVQVRRVSSGAVPAVNLNAAALDLLATLLLTARLRLHPWARATAAAAADPAAANSPQLYGLETGAKHWAAEVALPPGSKPAMYVAGDVLVVAAPVPGQSSLGLAPLAIATGAAGQAQELRTAAPLGGAAAATPAGLAVLSADGLQLCLLAGSPARASCQQLSQLSAKLPAGVPLALAPTSSGLVLAPTDPNRPGAALLAASASGFKLLADSATAAAVAGEAALDSETTAVAFVESVNGVDVELTVIDAASGKVLGASKVAGARQQAGKAVAPARAFLVPSRKGGAAAAVLLAWQDELLQLLGEGQVQWSREEALAGVTSSMFVDLPAEVGGAEGAALVAERPQMDLQQQLHVQVCAALRR
jgi:hypothetical protein